MARDSNSPRVLTHSNLIDIPLPKSGLTYNQQIVLDVIVVLDIPPVQLGKEYLETASRVTAFLGVPSPLAFVALGSFSQTSYLKPKFVPVPYGQGPLVPVPTSGISFISRPDDQVDVGVQQMIRNAALDARNRVLSLVDQTSAFVSNANNLGLSADSNPFAVIAGMVATRRTAVQKKGNAGLAVTVSPAQADQLVSDMTELVTLQQLPPPPDTTSSAASAVQLSSFRIHMEGYGTNGNSVLDLIRFSPTSREVAAAGAKQLSAAFDFRKRVPVVLFVADYEPDESGLAGAIVGWKKIADASGYIVKRRSVFGNSEHSFTLSNSDLVRSYMKISDYVQSWLLSFYDTIDIEGTCAFLDTGVPPDQQFTYTVQAYQVKNDTKDHIFNVDSNVTSLSSVNRNRITAQLLKLAQQSFGQAGTVDDVNPWPLVSQVLYSDDKFDWILSAVNSRASVNRNDAAADTRKLSYLGTRWSDLLQLMDAGKVVIPKNVNDVVSNVSDSVVHFGITQTIAEILHETGILYYLEGVDVQRNDSLQNVGTVSTKTSPLLSAIIASIDPETSTVDLKSLGSNLPLIFSNAGYTQVSARSFTTKGGKVQTRSDVGPADVNVPIQSDATGVDAAFFGVLNSPDAAHVDLTTFDGLSLLVRAVRIFSDEGPNRASTGDTSDGVIGTNDRSSSGGYVVIPPPAGGRSRTGSVSGIPVGLPIVIRKRGS